MIERLIIRNLAIVEAVEIEFGAGLNVLTGETGAGKSIILGALQLLAGGRASAETVRTGAKDAVVEAVFRTDALPELERELAARGIEIEDHELIVRRTVSAEGRSRAQIAGQLVPVSALSELFSSGIEIASQHGSQELLKPEAHGKLFDTKAGQLDLRTKVSEVFSELRALRDELARLQSEKEDRARRQDFLAFQVKEIDEAKLVAGESDALRAERARLFHTERLLEGSRRAAAKLTSDAALDDAPNARDLITSAARQIEDLAKLDPGLQGIARRLSNLSAELRDVAGDLEIYAERLEADPSRLEEIEMRLSLLERLQRKYGKSEDEILAFCEKIREELASVEGADHRLVSLQTACEEKQNALAALAKKLSKARKQAAETFSKEVEKALHELDLPKAEFCVALTPVTPPDGFPCTATGLEAIEFLFAANPGEPARALRRVASGGELSRVFLALKNVLRRTGAGMVLIFDEVDTGVGGRVADRIGRVLAEIASEHQVLCITHLPQVACRGTTHFQIQKHEERGRTSTQVRVLRESERVDEIARMAGGAEITEATRQHARELLRR